MSNNDKIKLIKTSVEALPYCECGQAFYWDKDLPGFGLRVGTKSKAFFVEHRINGRTVRVTLGKHPALTAPLAREMAMDALGNMVRGVNPVAEKRERKIKGITLAEVFDDFLSARTLKDKTIRDYKRVMSLSYPDWQKKPVVEITKNMVEKRHGKIGEERGEAFANLSARTLRSVLNFAAGKYETQKGQSILPENPVKRLSQTKQWYRVERRTGHLKPHEFKAWFTAVMEIENPVIRDYLIFVLLTGCRREEAARLQWADVSLEDRSFLIRDPKNRNPIRLPLSDYLLELLARRRSDSPFVFPAASASGHIEEPKKRVAQVGEKIGVKFSIHDLRRTFITVAESLDISLYALKGLVNHKLSNGDVTAGYVQLNADRLREPMQRITDFILKSAEIQKTGEVISLKSKNL
jgi:integrase